jgi:autotransporter-associated beta strand protein
MNRSGCRSVELAVILSLVGVGAAAWAGTAKAADTFIWTQLISGGNWTTPGNWSGGVAASGAGNTANFGTLNITADNTVHLNVPTTIGNLVFGDTAISSAAGWTLDNNASEANILTLAGTTPTITVNALGTGKAATISAVINGANGLTKDGAGTLTLGCLAGNTYTGGTIVNGGKLIVNNTIGSGAGDGSVTVKAGGALGGAGMIAGQVAVNAGGTVAPGAKAGTVSIPRPAAVTASSIYSEGEGADEPPYQASDWSGMTGSFPNGQAGIVWWTSWSSEGRDDLNYTGEWIEWNLGGTCTLSKMHVWNFNEDDYTDESIKKLDIQRWTGTAWETVSTGLAWDQAPNSADYAGFDQPFSTPITTSRIRLANLENYGSVWGVGVSEVVFYGSNDSSVGTLGVGSEAVRSSLTMAAGSTYEWEFDGKTGDVIAVAGALTLDAGWKLKLVYAGGTPVEGAQYDLFTYTGSFYGSLAADIDYGTTGWPLATIVQDDTTPGAGRIYLEFGLKGDTNNDHVVDAADYVTVKRHMGQSTGAGAADGDFDNDGTVDWDDLLVVMANFGAGSGTAGATTPEPCSAMLLVFGASALLRRRRKA